MVIRFSFGLYEYDIADKTNEKIKLQVIDKIAHLDYFYMEDEDTCIMLERIGKESDQSILKRFHNLLKIITYMIEIITLLITISTYSIVLALFILLISIPLYHAAMKCGKTDYKAFLESSNNYRRGAYFRRILMARETMEERMIFEYQPYINKKWETELEHAISIYKDKFLGVSTVVQNFGKYKMTLRENIKISDYKSTKETISAIKECGWKELEEKFPDGEDTMLAKEYGGIDLSGGQWEKLQLQEDFTNLIN